MSKVYKYEILFLVLSLFFLHILGIVQLYFIYRLENIVKFLETQSRFRVVEISEDRLLLEFTDSAQHSHLPKEEGFNLQLTLLFDTSITTEVVLADVKVNAYQHLNFSYS